MLYRFNKEKDISYVSLLYSIVVFVFFFGMSAISGMEFYRMSVIGEFVFILLPAILFVEIGVARGKKEFLRLNKIKASTGILVSFVILFSLPLFGLINNLIYYIFAELFGAVEIYSVPIPQGAKGVLLSLIVLALVPAVCEEVLFRGVIQGVLRRHGHIFAIIFTGALFSFLHLDIQRFIGIWLLGSLIGYMVYRTNSLYTGILAHLVNNVFSVAASYLFVDDQQVAKDGIQRITKESYTIFMTEDTTTIIASIVIVIIFGALFAWLFARFIRVTETMREIRIKTGFDRAARGYLFLIPPFALIIFLYILQSKSIISGLDTFLNLVAG
jgi:uncharacterized protein